MEDMQRLHLAEAAALRHKPGRCSQVMPNERREIQLAHLHEGLNQTALAARFGRTRETIAQVLKGDGFDALKREVDEEMIAHARRVLSTHRVPAARAWTRAMDVAAAKGDHRPAKDLLLHTDVIRPLGDGRIGTSQLIVCVGMPHAPACTVPAQIFVERARLAEQQEEAAESQSDTEPD